MCLVTCRQGIHNTMTVTVYKLVIIPGSGLTLGIVGSAMKCKNRFTCLVQGIQTGYTVR